MTQRKVLLLEINEVTWDLIDVFIAQGKLPNFARLKREGTGARLSASTGRRSSIRGSRGRRCTPVNRNRNTTYFSCSSRLRRSKRLGSGSDATSRA